MVVEAFSELAPVVSSACRVSVEMSGKIPTGLPLYVTWSLSLLPFSIISFLCTFIALIIVWFLKYTFPKFPKFRFSFSILFLISGLDQFCSFPYTVLCVFPDSLRDFFISFIRISLISTPDVLRSFPVLQLCWDIEGLLCWDSWALAETPFCGCY